MLLFVSVLFLNTVHINQTAQRLIRDFSHKKSSFFVQKSVTELFFDTKNYNGIRVLLQTGKKDASISITYGKTQY